MRPSIRPFAFLAAAALCLGVAAANASPITGPEAVSPVTREEIRVMLVQEALRSDGVPPSLALAVAHAESSFDPAAESSAGARGVMQIMPATGRGEFGVTPDELWEPRLNIQLGIAFLEQLIERFDGRWDLALSWYNGGSRVGSGPDARVIPATRAYVDRVLSLERRYARDPLVDAMIARAVLGNPALEPGTGASDRRRTLSALRAQTADRLRREALRLDRLDPLGPAGRDAKDHAQFPRHPVERTRLEALRPNVGPVEADRPARFEGPERSGSRTEGPSGRRPLGQRVGGAAGLVERIETRKARFRALLAGG